MINIRILDTDVATCGHRFCASLCFAVADEEELQRFWDSINTELSPTPLDRSRLYQIHATPEGAKAASEIVAAWGVLRIAPSGCELYDAARQSWYRWGDANTKYVYGARCKK